MNPIFNKQEQQKKAERFRELHHASRILVLPNAWDAASAKMFELAGFDAIATSSAGVSNACGYPDGERMSRAEMLDVVCRMARSVALPVTADMEAGFGKTPEEIAETARLTLEAGAVGLNLEDGTGDASQPLFDIAFQCEKIRAMRQTADAFGVPLVINARVDAYESLGGSAADRFAQTVKRGNAYREAGADCVFVMSVDDPKVIGELVREIKAPLNVLARHGSPPIPELEQIGVARVTFGSIPMRAAMATVGRIAEELKRHGTYSFAQGIPTYGEMNGYFEK